MSKILQINIIIVEVYLWWLSFWFIQRVVNIHWSHLKGTLKVSTRQHALLSCIFFLLFANKTYQISYIYSSSAHFFYFHAAVHCRCKVLIYSRRRLIWKVRIYWQHHKKSIASKKCYFVKKIVFKPICTTICHFFGEKINFYITLGHFFYFTIWWLFTRVFIYFKDKESPRAEIQKCLKKSAF